MQEHTFDSTLLDNKHIQSLQLMNSLDMLEKVLVMAAQEDSDAVQEAREILNNVRQEIYRLVRDQLELTTLYKIGRELASILDLSQLLVFILDQAICLVGAERGMLILSQGDEGEFTVPLARGIDRSEIGQTGERAVSQQLIQHVLLRREPLITTDAQSDSRFTTSSSIVELQIRSVLAVPLIYQQDLIGAIYLDTRLSVRPFEEDDLELLKALANQVAVAIHIAQLYEDLKTKNRELAAMLQELREAQEELIRTERLSAIGQMSSSIIHDIRGPLTNVKGFAQLLGRPDLDPKQRVRLSETISETVDSFVGMTQEILDYARGEQTLILEPLNVEEFLIEFKDFIMREFATFEVEIRLVLEYKGKIQADQQKLWRAFYNIAKNAAEAMSGMEKEKVFTISTRRASSWIEFELADTGPGISSELEEKVFQPFATHGKAYGTGLGLSIARSIVEAHGGDISFTTELGKGTTFSIRIPAKEMN